MKAIINVGLVGYGFASKTFHAPLIQATEGLDLVAVSSSDAAKVKAPLQIHFAAVDDRINNAWPTYEAALKAAGVRYVAHQYPGTQHGLPSRAK